MSFEEWDQEDEIWDYLNDDNWHDGADDIMKRARIEMLERCYAMSFDVPE